jgi:cellobiose phosphorylase
LKANSKPSRRIRYGVFDPAAGCYHLEKQPPRKWNNLHYNQPGEHEVYAEISNIGDGQIFVRDGAGNGCQLVSYDRKFLYIRDDDSGAVFCPGGEPAPEPVQDVSCTYWPAKTEIQGTCRGLRATQRVFVPRKEICEAWTLTLQNLTRKTRHVSVFAYAQFQLTGVDSEGKGVAADNSSEVRKDIRGVFVRNRDRSVPNSRFNGYLVTLANYAGGSGYRDHFTRSEFSFGTPKILWGWNADNRPGCGPDCAGVVQVRLTIPPKGMRRADLLLGQAKDLKEIRGVLKRLTPVALDAACDEQMQIERKHAAAFAVDTGRPDLDGLMNSFVKKQMVSYLINKSGFRDNLQNDMGVAMFDYPMARANLLRALASQYADGKVPHGFRPMNRLQYADKPCWILQVVPALIKESGDFALLDEVVPYFESKESGTVWDHLLRTMRYLVKDTGEHGLSDQHFADWNDGLEPSEKTGPRESVMVTQQVAFGLLEMEELARRRGDGAVAKEASDWHAVFTGRLNTIAWDGHWYQRTLCGTGYRIGTRVNPEARLFLNTQSWAILSQTAPPDRAKLCMQAVDRYLEKDCGFAIVDPPFTRFDERIGKYSAARPFYATNGGCYNHAAGFKAVADCMLGRAEEAWRTLLKVAPDSPWNPISRSWTEPFSFNNCFDRVPEIYGRGQYPWRTGTAAWFSIVLVEWILGARRHYDGLQIDPCLSKEVPRARLVRTFRGARFEIEIDNAAGRCRGVRSIELDGKPVSGNLLPDLHAGTHSVNVVI